MAKLFTNKVLILNILMAVAVLLIVIVSYSTSKVSYPRLKSCCYKMKQEASELPWESVSRHFISAVIFR
jgi:hypothetical protein